MEIDENNDIKLEEDFIKILLFELFNTNCNIIKFSLTQIFTELTCESNTFIYQINDLDYLKGILKISKEPLIIQNLLIIIGNVLNTITKKKDIINSLNLFDFLKNLKVYNDKQIHSYLVWIFIIIALTKDYKEEVN